MFDYEINTSQRWKDCAKKPGQCWASTAPTQRRATWGNSSVDFIVCSCWLVQLQEKKEKHDRILSVICSPTDTIRGPGDSCLHACTLTGIRLRPRGGLPLTTTQRWWLDLLIISTYDLLIFLPVTTLVKDLMNVEWLTCNHDLISRTLLHNSMRHKSLPSFHAISSTLLLESMSATLQLILVYGRLTRQSYQTNTTVRLMQFVPEYK